MTKFLVVLEDTAQAYQKGFKHYEPAWFLSTYGWVV